MSDESLSEMLIDRLRSLATRPNDNVEALRSTATRLHSLITSQDKQTREKTLERICNKNSGILAVLKNLLEVVRDQVTACNLAGILHECVARKSGKCQSSAIGQLLAMNASQLLVKLIVQQQGKDTVLSDALMLEIVWTLSYLAQRDPKFSIKTRLTGSTKTFHNLLKTYINSTKLLYPILLVIKSLAKSSSTISLLVKDGIVSTMEKTVISIEFTPNPKLRMALNVIGHFTKSKLCCIHIVRSGILVLLLRIFERWERYGEKIRLKICNYILIALHHICVTKMGCKTLCRLNIMNVLYKFSIRCPEDKRYDNLLVRACNIINICVDRKDLPIKSVMSPAVFKLPALDDTGAGTVLHSTFSHETSPSSDDNDFMENDTCSNYGGGDYNDDAVGEGEDESDSDDDFETRKESGENTGSSFGLHIQRDVQDLIGYAHYFQEFENSKQKNNRSIPVSSLSCDNIRSCTETLHETILNDKLLGSLEPYRRSMLNMGNEEDLKRKVCKNVMDFDKQPSDGDILLNSKDICSPAVEEAEGQTTEKRSNLERQMLFTDLSIISDISKDLSFKSAYAKIASNVNSILPFAKVAYPDMMGGDSAGVLEPLNVKDRRICRSKLLACVNRAFAESDCINNVVYDLDTLIAQQIPNDDKNRWLFNLDDVRLGKKDLTKHHLCFESRFESGNLRKVIQVGQREYDLILMPDVNSSRHHQWFYFEVSNMEANVPYVFNIINCEKENSQFNYGMKPIMYSVQEAISGQSGWVRVGTDICYYSSCYQNASSCRPRSYFTVTFTITFPHSYDVCYLAYHYPYTYSQLLAQIWRWSLMVDPATIYFRAETLCSSLNKNDTPLLTITGTDSEANSIMTRETIFLTARVHPGESNSSWIMHGTINYLLGNSPAAMRLRSRFVFKIVPMLNLEGVINGCYRCGLMNEDLNRCWKCPSAYLHPVIHHTKGLLEYCVRILKKPPYVFCDYHGHSRRKNVFLYGCSNSESWCEMDRARPDNPAEYLLLPHLMQCMSPAFALHLCNFKVQRIRESTARVTVWREFGIKRSYTMESSYCGCDQGLYEGHHMNTMHLKEIGQNLCDALACLHDESYWRTGTIASSPGPLRLDIQRKLSESAVEVSESERSDLSECEEDCH